ncbi:hypothetical protein JHD50_00685 [Sulfurimonas sp. MAG313]|nr:hypothetical protein [Sulfurimonas sp. MAG313]MDF1879830.1 hypothetical protein [Sulfurimonas sp. MAG313]
MIKETLLAINSKELLEFEISLKSVISYCIENNIEAQLVKDVLYVEFQKKSIQITSKGDMDMPFSTWECY